MNTVKKREWHDFWITAFLVVFQIFIIVQIESFLLVILELIFNVFFILMLIVTSVAYSIWQDDLAKKFGPPKQEEAEEWYKYSEVCMKAENLHNHFVRVKTTLAVCLILFSIFDFSSLIEIHNFLLLIAILWHMRKAILTETE